MTALILLGVSVGIVVVVAVVVVEIAFVEGDPDDVGQPLVTAVLGAAFDG